MHPKVRNRLLMVVLFSTLVASGIWLVLELLSDNLVFFLTPSELKDEHLGKDVRVGGLVTVGSVQHMPNRTISFMLTDNKKTITVTYRGIIPTLFREGQGIVAEGVFEGLSCDFKAQKLLTKHDENYKPPMSESGK
ncbi:MAG: hypothetical protein RLZZ59_115 [Pseudomonadota bacterium]|jgi:cytochrome c-type biogenesis protein CcmE